MKKVNLLLMFFLLSSCSYVHYRNHDKIKDSGSFIHEQTKPLIGLHPYFELVDVNEKSKSFDTLSHEDKMVLFTLFPRITDFNNNKTQYSLKKLIIKRENITNNLTPSIFSVFSVLTIGIFPSYVTSSIIAYMTLVDNKTGKEKYIELRPKYIKGMGVAFGLLAFKENWFKLDDDPYTNNLSEYYQDYMLERLNNDM